MNSSDWLVSMVNAIDREVPLEEADKVLILLQLDTEDKISTFNEWGKTKLVNDELVTTPEEVMHATAKVGRLSLAVTEALSTPHPR